MTVLWQRTNTLLLVLVLLALLAIIAMLAMRAEGGPLDPTSPPGPTDSVRLPGTPINGQTTISSPGHYYLTRDINVPGATTAITIAASNVSLDLGGFTVSGNDTTGSFGILTSGSIHDIEIAHGTVRDFHIALSTGNLVDARIDDVFVTSSIRGFDIEGSESVLTNCISSDNSETGLYLPASFSIVRDCSILSNAKDGISITGSNNVIERSVIDTNSYSDTTAYKNLRIGGPATTVRDNTFINYPGSIRIEVIAQRLLDNVCVGATIFDASPNPSANTTAATDHLNVTC